MAELWYFTCEGKQMEPVTTSELKQLASTGFLRGADMVWQEGMPAWVKADSIPGLVPPAAPQAIKAKSDSAVLRQQPAKEDSDELRPRRRHRAEGDDFDDRPRRRREPAKGMSGLVLGLVVLAVAFVVLVAVGGIVYLVVRAPIRNRPPVAVFQQKRNFPVVNLPMKRIVNGPPLVNIPVFGPKITEQAGVVQPDVDWDKVVFYPTAKWVEVDVDSDNPANDVDLCVIDQNGAEVGFDRLISHTCRVTFMAEANRNYSLRISNLGPFPANCSFTYTRP